MAQETTNKTTTLPVKDVEQAIKQFRDRADAVTKSENYYNGEHELKFASEKFINTFGTLFKTFALNLCPAICDAVRDKLVISGYKVEDGAETKGDLPAELWKMWQNNRLDIVSGEIHKEATVSGDAYAIVWVNDKQELTVYPNKAANVTVIYDQESPGRVMYAAKQWRTTEKKYRINLYYPDRIVRLVSKKQSEMLPDAKLFEEFAPDIANPYGMVPVFHFANNGEIGGFGKSELADAMPLQDALNKTVLDMLVTMEFASYRQRWAAGIEIEYDDEGKAKPPFTAGIEKLWITETPDTKFGDFEVTDLEQFLKVKDSFKVDLAHVSGTPLYYFMQTGANFPSGEALKKAETRFINKVIDRQKTFGAVWADVMAFALTIENKGKAVRLFTEWEDPAPLSEKEDLENLLIKQDLGVSDEQLLIEAGYGEDDIKKMMQANADKAEAAVKSFNAGEDLATESTEDTEK